MNQSLPITVQEAIINGLTRHMALRLRGSPAAENIQQTAAVWMDVMTTRPITWDVDLDLWRIERAFANLAATITHWPSPADFLNCMPERKLQLKLDAPVNREPMSPKTRALVDGMLRKLRRETA